MGAAIEKKVASRSAVVSALRFDGLLTSLVAVLISESCNVGLTPVINPNLVELTRARLSHVDQNYLRADTIAAANALLIEAQSRVELAQIWGGGPARVGRRAAVRRALAHHQRRAVTEVLRLQTGADLAQPG